MWSSAWRAFLLLNGGWRKFGLSQPCAPSGSMRNVCRSGFCSILGTNSSGGSSHQSTSPAARASATSQGSGMYRQITLSRYTFLPPVEPLGGSSRGMQSGFRTYTTCSPGCHSSLANLNGPDPTISLICSSGGVDAIRAGIMKGGRPAFPRASSTGPKGSASSSVNVFLSTGAIFPVCAIRSWPRRSFFPQRFNDSTQSSDSTGCPSCHHEAVAQHEVVLHAVRRHGGPVDHLWFDLKVLVRAEEGVVHKIAVVARDVGGRPDGIEDLQVRLRHETEGLPFLLRSDRRRAQRRDGGGRSRALDDLSATDAAHHRLPSHLGGDSAPCDQCRWSTGRMPVVPESDLRGAHSDLRNRAFPGQRSSHLFRTIARRDTAVSK